MFIKHKAYHCLNPSLLHKSLTKSMRTSISLLIISLLFPLCIFADHTQAEHLLDFGKDQYALILLLGLFFIGLGWFLVSQLRVLTVILLSLIVIGTMLLEAKLESYHYQQQLLILDGELSDLQYELQQFVTKSFEFHGAIAARLMKAEAPMPAYQLTEFVNYLLSQHRYPIKALLYPQRQTTPFLTQHNYPLSDIEQQFIRQFDVEQQPRAISVLKGVVFFRFQHLPNSSLKWSVLFIDTNLLENDLQQSSLQVDWAVSDQISEHVWLGESVIFEQHPVYKILNHGEAKWAIAAVPKSGWETIYSDSWLIRLTGFALSVFVLFFGWLRIRQKHIDQRLHQLSGAVTQSHNGILITDLQGKITFINPALSRITGYSADELLDKSPNVFKSKQHSDSVYQDLWNTIKSGKAWQGELINRHKNGKLGWHLVTITPLTDQRQQVTH